MSDLEMMTQFAFRVITALEGISLMLVVGALFVRERERRGKLCMAGFAVWVLSHFVGAIWRHFLF
jgi:hypothetical protein